MEPFGGTRFEGVKRAVRDGVGKDGGFGRSGPKSFVLRALRQKGGGGSGYGTACWDGRRDDGAAF